MIIFASYKNLIQIFNLKFAKIIFSYRFKHAKREPFLGLKVSNFLFETVRKACDNYKVIEVSTQNKYTLNLIIKMAIVLTFWLVSFLISLFELWDFWYMSYEEPGAKNKLLGVLCIFAMLSLILYIEIRWMLKKLDAHTWSQNEGNNEVLLSLQF